MAAALVGLALAGCAGSNKKASQLDAARLRAGLAQTYVKKGAHAAALPLLQQAVAERPRDAALRVRYGVVLRECGELRQAEQQMRVALRLGSRRAEAHAELALLLDLEGRHAEAVRAHRRAVQLAPRNARYWNNLGFSYQVAGRHDEAVGALRRAIALGPALVVAANNLGFAYASRGDYRAAQRWFRVAVGEEGAAMNLAAAWRRRSGADADADVDGDVDARELASEAAVVSAPRQLRRQRQLRRRHHRHRSITKGGPR